MIKRGFSLIEVIIALSISAVVFTATIPLIYNTITSNRLAKLKFYAYQAAHKEIEKYKNVNISQFQTHAFTVSEIPSDPTYTTTGELIVNLPHEDLAEITSRVTWTYRGKNEVAEIKTFIYGVAE